MRPRLWGRHGERSSLSPREPFPSTSPCLQSRTLPPKCVHFQSPREIFGLKPEEKSTTVLVPIHFHSPHSSLCSKGHREHSSHFLNEGSAGTQGPHYGPALSQDSSDDSRDSHDPFLHQSLQRHRSLKLPKTEKLLTNRGTAKNAGSGKLLAG